MYTSSKSRSKSSGASLESIIFDTIPDFIGGPPDSGSDIVATTNLMSNSGLQVFIQPCKPKAETGLSLFILNVDEGWTKYKELLKRINFQPTSTQEQSKGITIICQAENYPNDSFQNDYGESFLNQITDVASGAFGQLAQITGQETGSAALQQTGNTVKEGGKQMGGGMISDLMIGAGGIAEAFGKNASSLANEWSKEKGIKGTIGTTMNKLLAGARIDFPKVWKGSSYSPTFSCSVKLYNPNPASDDATKKYIIAPLAALLTLSLPQSDDDNAYNYPFFCKVNCPGLFKINAGAISNITVVKGGDQGMIGFNQRVAMVDVRIEFINLHDTLLLSTSGVDTRPTLKGYLDNMLDKTETEPIYDVESGGGFDLGDLIPDINSSSISTDLFSPPPSRIDTAVKTQVSSLISQAQSGIYD